MRKACGSLILALMMAGSPSLADDAADLAAAQAAFNAGDYAKMLPLVQGLADRGNGEGLRALAVVYLRGQGVAKDEAKGVEWMTKAANAGLAAAQHDLGSVDIHLIHSMTETSVTNAM